MSMTLAPSRSVTARDPKGLKFVSIVEAAYNKTGLSEEEAQRVNEASGLAALIGNFIAENRVSDRFKDEEVHSDWAYPPEYKGPRPVAEQIAKLRELFPQLETADTAIAEGSLPEGAEGWFAVPKWEVVASTYSEATNLALARISSSRKFINYLEDKIDEGHLHQHERTARTLKQMAEQQNGNDILVLAAQLGLRHRGRSVRRAREVFSAGEFGLGAFAVACVALTHPERLVRWEELDMDCSGDEFNDTVADGRFDDAPFFCFGDGGVRFGADRVDDADDADGSVSAFRPQ